MELGVTGTLPEPQRASGEGHAGTRPADDEVPGACSLTRGRLPGVDGVPGGCTLPGSDTGPPPGILPGDDGVPGGGLHTGDN